MLVPSHPFQHPGLLPCKKWRQLTLHPGEGKVGSRLRHVVDKQLHTESFASLNHSLIVGEMNLVFLCDPYLHSCRLLL